MTLPVCWAKGPFPGNAGDVFTPWLLGKDNVPFRHANPTKPGKHLMAGSIAVWARNGDTIWGTGNSHQSLEKLRGLKLSIRAVRGPETRARLLEAGHDCPERYGDPALLAPRFHFAPVEKRHALGIVPHYWDLKLAPKKVGRIISPMRSEKQLAAFLDEIRSCDRIISSSLHGLIFAHAYGIPARWVEFSNNVFGGGLKFRDYLRSIGRKPYEPTWPEKRDWEAPGLQIDLDALWGARPWR